MEEKVEEKDREQAEERMPTGIFLCLMAAVGICLYLVMKIGFWFAFWLGQQPWPIVVIGIIVLVLLGRKAQKIAREK